MAVQCFQTYRKTNPYQANRSALNVLLLNNRCDPIAQAINLCAVQTKVNG